ncbi:MAG: prenyltransferase/squalene oxidase repeat-containing protein [Verrucomicrobiota bacterium]
MSGSGFGFRISDFGFKHILACLALAVTLCLPHSLLAADNGTKEKSAASGRDTVIVDKETEETIHGALKWLVSKQSPNGSWGTSGEESSRRVAMTGYTLMAFLAAGQLPGEGEFGKSVALGMNYLLDQVQPDGIIGKREDGQYMYGHGIATIALAELYGQTRSGAIKTKLERMIRVIISSQNTEGGWRYRPVAKDADVSVTVLSVVAVRAAKNAGLEVPQRTIDDAVKYVKRCFDKRSGGFCYQPNGSPGFARTAAAIYSLQVCGLYDDPLVKSGSEYLLNAMTKKNEHKEYFTYGHFYAAPAQYMIGGETWEKWYNGIKAILLEAAAKDGDKTYWDPKQDRGREVGPTYCTAVYTMILAMPYHYLPLYQR